jgi:hypothetical protein
MGYKNVTTTVDKEAVLGYDPIPLLRPKLIYFEFQGLRPNIPHWIFFGGKEVTRFCNTSFDETTLQSASKSSKYKEVGDLYTSQDTFPTELGGATGTPLYTNSVGELSGLFYIQSNTTVNFPTNVEGTNFIALDISKLDVNESLSYGASKFYGFGQYENYYQYKEKVTTSVYYDDGPKYVASNSDNGSNYVKPTFSWTSTAKNDNGGNTTTYHNTYSAKTYVAAVTKTKNYTWATGGR